MFGTTTDRIRDLENEARYQRERAEQLEEDNRRASEERHERLEQSRREAREQIALARRQADNWPEAFNKQIGLFEDELRFAEVELRAAKNGEYPEGEEAVQRNQQYVDDLNATIASIKTAREIYNAEMNRVRKQIEALEQQAREAVILKLRDDKALAGTNFVDHFTDDDPSEWLNW